MKNMTLFKTALIASAVALFAFGGPAARAATCETTGGGGNDCVAAEGHVSASVASTLDVHEITPMKFGNFKITVDPLGAGDATIVLQPSGGRSVTAGAGTTAITLLHGANMVNPEAVTGVAAGVAPGNDLETGSQAPGFYAIHGGNGTDGVFVTFSDTTGNPIDTNHDGTNHVVLTCLTCADPGNTFFVDRFTFVTTDATGNLNTPSQTDIDGFGQFTATDVGGNAIIKVGATMHTDPAVTTAYDDGAYRGTFYIMVSY